MEKNVIQDKIDYIFNVLILLIGTTFFIRKVSTLLIIVLVVFCILFKRKMQFTKEGKILSFIISSLFLVEFLFLWNSSDLGIALKSLEKYLSLLVLPIVIIGNYQAIKYRFLIENYARLVFILTAFFLARFAITEPEKIDVYLSGNLLWEAGYVIAESFGNHAPNVNLHLAFVSSILFYYFIKDFNKRGIIGNLLRLFMIIAVSYFVFIINTRIALMLMFFGYLFILVFYLSSTKTVSWKSKLGIVFVFFALLGSTLFVINKVPYFKEKYTTVTFGYLSKVGKLDEIDQAESKAYNSFALRLSIWESAFSVIKEHNVLIGVGASDLDPLLFEQYEKTEQHLLFKYKLGIHNQYIESLGKFGIIGLLALLFYISLSGYLGLKMKNVLMLIFFFNMLIANLFDSYFSLFMGIVYSGWFLCIFSAYYLQRKYPITD